MRTLFLAWQDQLSTRRWFVVGRLDKDGTIYRFAYVRQAAAAKAHGFEPLLDFPEMDKPYESSELFPVFMNRLLSTSRPDYMEFLRRLGMNRDDADPLTILGLTEGQRATDSFEVFLKPVPDEKGKYRVSFFARGLRHVDGSEDEVVTLQPGDKLGLKPEPDNNYDDQALIVITVKDREVGYVPRYLCKDLRLFLEKCPEDVQLEVAQVNPPPAPAQQRLLCSFVAPWPESWVPFAEPELSAIVPTPV